MARIRSIKPDYFDNEDLAQASLAARLLGIGLTTLADRDGRLEDRPLRIRARVFPYDQLDCDALLNELEDAHFIHRYAVENRHYIQIVNFRKHQQPHPKEKPSLIPEPVELSVNIGESPEKVSTDPSVLGSSVYGSSGNGILDRGNGKPQAKPRRNNTLDDPNAQARADLMTLLAETNGPIASPGPQTKAIHWLFEVGYSPDECSRCFIYLTSQVWRSTAVTWQTVKKEIGAWKSRGEPAAESHNGNGHVSGHAKTSNVDYSMANVNAAYERAVAEELNEERSN